MEIVRGFANLPKITLSTCGRDDDVFVDRLNYKYTTTILFVSSITITVKILQSDHIQCWVPAILSRYEHYINVYCWISNTYYVAFKEQTTSLVDKPERMIKYYQWVPMILLILSFFFLLPRFVYRALGKHSGVDMLNLADAAINYMAVEKFDKRRRTLLYLANSIHFYSICNKSKRSKGGFGTGGAVGAPTGAPISGSTGSKPHLYNIMCCYGKIHGSFLVCLFMMTKLFYIANSIAQLFIMNIFLGFNYNKHGFHLLKDIGRGLLSNTNALSAQRKKEAEAKAEAFAANLNIKNPFGTGESPILGPAVIFDSFETSQRATFDDAKANIFADPTYSIPATHTMMHRYFPRESACDFRIRAHIDSLVHNYTVQCVLPINLYNEQLFTLLWAWLWLVTIANCYDFIVWCYRLTPGSRFNYIRSRVRLKYSENSVKRNLNSFIYDYLTFDGVFILRIMSLSMSDCVTHEIVQTLWQNYTEVQRKPTQNERANDGGRGNQYQNQYANRGGGDNG